MTDIMAKDVLKEYPQLKTAIRSDNFMPDLVHLINFKM